MPMNVVHLLHLEHAIVSTIFILLILVLSLLAFRRPKVFGDLLLHPYGVVHRKEYFRLFTSQFVHGDRLHLIANIYMLYISCVSLENYLCSVSRFGNVIFLGIYCSTLLFGGLITTMRHYRDPGFTSAGASGAVMGCMFSFMVLQPDFVALYLPFVGPVKNVYAALVFILLLLKLQFRGQRYFNHELHLYCAVAGIICGLAIKHSL